MISFGAVNVNSPQQNAGVFIGQMNLGGWDANMKQNTAHAALYGFYNVIYLQHNTTVDSMEVMDGVINDSDFKPLVAGNL